MPLTTNLLEELAAIEPQPDYVAVELLWNILVKAAHSKNDADEFGRLKLLITDLTSGQADLFVQEPAVNRLLDLDPPLETVFANSRERFQAPAAAAEIATIRAERVTDPRNAAQALLSLLKRIRNKRVHGFKTPKGPRDAVILGAARPLIAMLCHALIH